MPVKETPEYIQDVTLDVNDELVVVVPQSFGSKSINNHNTRLMEYDLIFFEVDDEVSLEYEPYNLHDSSGSAVGNISSDAGQDYQRLYDSNGEDILRIRTDQNPWYIYHYSISVEQSGVYVYPQVPEEANQPGFTWATNTPNPTNGDPFGKISSDEMTYHKPPVDLETVAFRSGDQSHNRYGFYNSTSSALTPNINVKGKTYLTSPINDSGRQNDILAKLRENHNSVRAVTYGPVTETFPVNYPDDWQQSGNIMTTTGPLYPKSGSALEENESGGN